MIYESRVYRCVPGRLPALLKRFETITLKLWEKHGIRQAGFFTTLIGESNQELTYFLAWESLADREKKWAAFQSDPDWIAARAQTEADGQIVDVENDGGHVRRPLRHCEERSDEAIQSLLGGCGLLRFARNDVVRRSLAALPLLHAGIERVARGVAD